MEAWQTALKKVAGLSVSLPQRETIALEAYLSKNKIKSFNDKKSTKKIVTEALLNQLKGAGMSSQDCVSVEFCFRAPHVLLFLFEKNESLFEYLKSLKEIILNDKSIVKCGLRIKEPDGTTGTFILEGVEKAEYLDIIMSNILNVKWQTNLAKSIDYPEGCSNFKIGTKNITKYFFKGIIPFELIIASQQGRIPIINPEGQSKYLSTKTDAFKRCNECNLVGHTSEGCPIKGLPEDQKKEVITNLKDIFQKRQSREAYNLTKKKEFESLKKNPIEQKPKYAHKKEEVNKAGSYKEALTKGKTPGEKLEGNKTQTQAPNEGGNKTGSFQKQEPVKTETYNAIKTKEDINNSDVKNSEKEKIADRTKSKRATSPSLKSSDSDAPLSQVEDEEMAAELPHAQNPSLKAPPELKS